VHTDTSAAPEDARRPVSGEAFTRRAITIITTAAIVIMTFAFNLGNVTKLCLDLGITAWIAWFVADVALATSWRGGSGVLFLGDLDSLAFLAGLFFGSAEGLFGEVNGELVCG
jgi:hypothetical protein